MRKVLFFSTLSFFFAASLGAQSSRAGPDAQAKQADLPSSAAPAALQAARASFAKLPLSFEENLGQTDERVKYTSRGSGYNLFLTADEAVFALRGPSVSSNCAGQDRKFNRDCTNSPANRFEVSVLRLKMLGANSSAQILGSDPLPGKINYYVGNVPSKWRTGVRQYGRVSFQGIYPGVDLTYYGNQQQLESDFVVEPGASPRAIEFEVTGARELRLDEHGNLVLGTDAGNVQILRPGIYQTAKGIRRDISGRYVIRGKDRVGLEIGSYNRQSPLIIDPIFVYSTYVGGSNIFSGGDSGNAIAIDSTGAAYVTGTGGSTDFPGSAQNGPVAVTAPFAFVTKFDPTGNSIVYSTLLRGTTGLTDAGNGLGLDNKGNVYVDGITGDSDFPLLNPFQATLGDVFSAGFSNVLQSGFVAGLDSNGALIYSTYLGGRNSDDFTYLNGIAVDTNGNAYVVGDTTSHNFPTVNSYQATSNVAFQGEPNVVVAEFNPQGQPIYSTYLGGSSRDVGNAIAIDASGNAYVTGQTSSIDFPVQKTPAPTPFQATNGGGEDVFVSKLTFDAVHSTLSLANSTYLGGAGNDEAFGIAVDSATPPNVYLTGQTNSKGLAHFPTQNPISGPSTGFAPEAFVTKLSGDFTSLLYSTFLGGTGGPSSVGDAGYAIALDGMNPPDVFITGSTASVDFPSQLPLQSILTPLATSNAFVTEVNGTGTALLYSTYLGGRGADLGKGIAVDRPTGDAYLTGSTTSPNFPVLSSSGGATKPFQDQLGTSAGNAFITKISPTAAPGLNFFPPTFDFHNIGVGLVSQAESVTLSNNSGGSVTIDSLSLGGNNPSDFAIGTIGSICTNGLILTATGATSSCVVNLTFNPQLQDARSATLTATYNSTSTATMNLLGFGAVPELSFSPATLNFGTNVPLNVTTVRGISLTNPGGGPLNVGNVEITGTDATAYRIPSPNACKLIAADGGSCFFEVDFTPTAAVSYNNAALQINDNVAGSPQSIPITGAGADQVIVSPASVEFGGWLVGTSSPDRSISVLNGSGGNITLSAASTGNTPNFPPDPNNNTCTNGLVMLPGVSCTYDTFFKPATGSTFDGLQAMVTFSWTGTKTGSQAVTLMGTGETGVTLYQNSVTAPAEYVGATEKSIGFDQIFNGSTSPVTVTGIVLSGANPQDYLVELNTSCSINAVIPANSVCYLDGAFSPSTVGTRTATATINYTINSPTPTSGSLTLNLTGTGNPGPVNFPSAFDFGGQIVNILAPTERVYLQNVGKAPLAISTVSAITGANANDFAIASSSTCASSTTVPNGGKCFFDLTFTPDKTGSLTASLTVIDNGPGSPRTLTLTGTGEPAVDTVSVLPNALDFGGVVLVAPPATQPQSVAKVYLTNSGAQPATISVAPALTATGTPFTIATGTNTTTCLLNTVVLPQGGTCSVVVTFAPTNTVQTTNNLALTYTVGIVQTPITVPIKGIGVNQGVLSFGTPATFTEAKSAPTSAPQSVTLTNSGTGPVTISSLYLTGGSSSDFAIVPTQSTCAPGTIGATIAAGSSCVVVVTFTAPATVGTYTASALVTADLGNNVKGSASTTLAGTVVVGGLSASPNPIDFGTVATGASVTFSSLHGFNSISLTNNNPAPVAITSIAPQNAGDFTVTSNGCPAGPLTLSNQISRNSCSFDIAFAPGPTVNGPETANNIVVSYGLSGQSGQFLIPIKGAGSPALVATPNPLNATGSVGGFGSNPTITIGNGTTSPVTITSVDTFTGAGYSFNSNSCTLGALGPGTTCQIFLTYNPTIPGNSSTSFNVTYTVGSSTTLQTLVVTLNGSAKAPQATITPDPSPSTPLVFPAQVINSQSLPLSVKVTNTGNAPLTFDSFKISGANFNDFAIAPQQTNISPSQYPSIASCSSFGFGNTIQSGQSCTIPLTFTPAPSPLPGGAARNATLTITDNAYPSKTQTVLLEGNATGGSVTVSPTSLSSPDTIVGSSLTQSVLITNSSAAAVTFSSVSFGTSSYSVDTTQTLNACSTSKPLSAFTGSCVVYIKFTPQPGANADTATIHTNSNSPTVALTGTGTAPVVMLAPTTVSFAAQALNTTSAPMNGTLANTGTAALHLATATITGTNAGDFAIAAGGSTCTNSSTVAPSNGSCTWSVTYTPTAAGTRTATLTFTDDNNGVTGSMQTVALSGITPPPPTLSPSAPIAFLNQAVGTTSNASSITLTNPSGSMLHITSVAISGTNAAEFAVATTGTTCMNGSTVAPAASCVINVTFTPTTAGAHGPATLTITDDASPAIQTTSLSGTGISFTLSVPIPPVPAAAGQPIMAAIKLTPDAGGFPYPVGFYASNLPRDTTASFSQSTITAGAAAVTTVLTLTTTARSGGNARSTPPSRGPISGGWIATALLALLAMVTLRQGLRTQRFAYLPLAVLLLSAAIITGCAAAATGTPAGNYTVTVKATSGSYSQSMPVAITVR